MQLHRIDIEIDRQGSAQTRPTRRIEVLDENMDIPRGLLGRDVAGRGRQADQLQLRIEQGQRHRERAINAGVGHDNEFACHTMNPSCLTVRHLSHDR